MVDSNFSPKQQRIKDNFESKEVVNNLDIFAARMITTKNIQVGAFGT